LNEVKPVVVREATEMGFAALYPSYALHCNLGSPSSNSHEWEKVMATCIVIVQFDLPKRTEEQAIKGGTGTAPIYRDLATKGLIRKDYLNGDAGTGGVYLWENRQAAEAWFTESKIAELTERFGARPRLTWYDTHVTVDNLKGETRVNRHPLPSAAE
jgi:hypothetical protein